MPDSIDQIVGDPNWLCIGFDPASATVHFVKATMQSLDSMVFIDPAELQVSSKRAFALQEVASVLEQAGTSRDGGLIMHTAFSCSTLLARCLQNPGRVQVLRELPVFSGLASARERLLGKLGREGWMMLLKVVDRLSTRPFSMGGVTLNKPSNTFLAAASDFMAASPTTRSILIHTGLPDFLVSCLKRTGAGSAPWIRMYQALDPVGRYASSHWAPDATATPMQWACTIWHLQMHQLAALSGTGAAARTRQLPADRFLAYPEASVAAAQGWLAPGIGGEPDMARIRSELGRHAKQPAAAFDPRNRRREIGLAHRHFGHRLQDSLSWSDKVFGSWETAYRLGAGSFSQA